VHTPSDYGFEEAFGLTGPCVRDPAIVLDNPCAVPNTTNYMQTRGYVHQWSIHFSI